MTAVAPEASWTNTCFSSSYRRWVRVRKNTMSGMATTISHAPLVNSVTMKMRVTTALNTKAEALTMRFWRRFGPGWVTKYLVMPAPAMVKPVNTVQAYSGIRSATRARVTTNSTMETTVRAAIPFEYTNR